MTYMKVRWNHDASDDEPRFLYSELDSERWEVRKIDIFDDGTAIWATANEIVGDIGLSIEPIPPFEQIAADPEFDPEIISAAEFERIWTEGRKRPRGL